MKRILCFVLFCLSSIVIAAQENELNVPTEVEPFVEKNTKAIALETADLNGDGTKDFVLVLEDTKGKPQTDEWQEEGPRSTLILTRAKNGELSLAKRNNKVVFCRTCGGMLGEPFQGMSVGPKTFTIHLYGGSAWRWGFNYTFNYSRIDKTWQLVRASEDTYHTSEPNKGKTKIYMPPKSFGKIDFADFDPQNFLRKSKR